MKLTKTQSKRHIARKHVHKRVLSQLVIFVIVFLVLVSVVTYDMFAKGVSLAWVFGGLILGAAVGIAAARMFALRWHEDTQKVILRMDKLSFLLIAAYIVFRIVSDQFLSEFIHGDELTAVTFSVLAGVMLGRMLSMSRGTIAILKQQKII